MLNNKLSGKSWIYLLGLLGVSVVLTACGSKPVDEASPMPEPTPEPVEVTQAEPEPVADLPPSVPVESINPTAPDRYVVQKGDTLWDIASRFLNDPWLWPKVWHINPEIRNPHLIYPGDVIALHYVESKPYLTLEGVGGTPAPKGMNTTKLSPKVRYKKLDSAISTIPRSAIEPFLYRPRVVTEDQINAAPYIVGNFGNKLVSGNGMKVYAKKVHDQSVSSYDVVRPGETYKDPVTGELLGIEVTSLATARLVRAGEPATLTLSGARAEVLDGDFLARSEAMDLDFNFFPFAPTSNVNGQIISVFNGVSQIGQYNVVVLNRGTREGLEPGNVLAIYQKGEDVFDPYGRTSTSKVTLPDEKVGLLMVFRSYERVSYALVMSATQAIHLLDRVTNP